MTVITLWTFIFLAPKPMEGQAIYNLTQKACYQMQADLHRMFGQPGQCLRQVRELP
jgi:hypothetical protein